jgi:hypothetical protein
MRGIRWSELLRLPYFDLSRCIMVDSMHNLFLGLIKTHFCGVLGIGSEKRSEDPVISVDLSPAPVDFKSSEKKSLEKLKNWLQAPLVQDEQHQALRKLKSFHLRVLKFVARNYQAKLPVTTTRRSTIGQLFFLIGYAFGSNYHFILLKVY